VIRLDAKNASAYTKLFRAGRPFDVRFHNCMIAAGIQVLKLLPDARVAYTQSDEITVLIPPVDPAVEGQTRSFAARLQKLCSLSAAAATAGFARAMSTQPTYDSDPPRLAQHMQSTVLLFDARVFTMPTELDAYDALHWRAYYDCNRNAISSLCTSLPGMNERTLSGVSTPDRLKLLSDLLDSTGDQRYNYTAYPSEFRRGSYIKRTTPPAAAEQALTPAELTAARAARAGSLFEARSFLMRPEDRVQNTQLCFAKYWPAQ